MKAVRRSRGLVGAVVVAFLGGVGCLPLDALRTRASADLECEESQIDFKQLGPSIYAAEGCGQRATYVHGEAGWLMESTRAEAAASQGGESASKSSEKTPGKKSGSAGSDEDESEIVQGSGFVVDDAGSILTANHVVERVKKVFVQCGLGERTTADVVKRDKRHDLAVLRSARPSAEYLPLGSSDGTALGEQVFTVGFPVSDVLGSEPKFTEGTISSLKGIQDSNDVFQISVPIQPGNSGGPLVGKDGTVVGVITSTASVRVFFEATGSLPQGVNWAVKSDLARPLLASSASTGSGGTSAKPSLPKTREESISRARSAACLIFTRDPSASPSKGGVPKGAAGFQFGMHRDEAERVCNAASGTWKDDAGTAECSKAPAAVGFEARVHLSLCDGTLCRVTLVSSKEQVPIAEQLAAFTQVVSVLSSRYGQPEWNDELDGTMCSSETECLASGRSRLRRDWKWPSKPSVSASLVSSGGNPVITIDYVDVPAQPHPKKKKHPVKKKTAAEEAPGL